MAFHNLDFYFYFLSSWKILSVGLFERTKKKVPNIAESAIIIHFNLIIIIIIIIIALLTIDFAGSFFLFPPHFRAYYGEYIRPFFSNTFKDDSFEGLIRIYIIRRQDKLHQLNTNFNLILC